MAESDNRANRQHRDPKKRLQARFIAAYSSHSKFKTSRDMQKKDIYIFLFYSDYKSGKRYGIKLKAAIAFSVRYRGVVYKRIQWP